MSGFAGNQVGRRAELAEGDDSDGRPVYMLRLYRENGQLAVTRRTSDFRSLAAEASDWMDWSERAQLHAVLLAVGARHD